MITAEELVTKLRSALQSDGDFPVSAKIVSELRQLTSDPKTTAEQITEVILREPSLGTRVLHFVNSAFTRRAKPILTVSQAVVQIGMKPLTELCSGLVLLQKFVPTARRSSPFAYCLKRTVLVSLLSGTLVRSSSGGKQKTASTSDEGGYLVGQFAELGVLLLGFYFPEILDAAFKRSEQKSQELSQSIRDITGLSPWKLSEEVIQALGLPKFFTEVLEASDPSLINSDPTKIISPQIQSAAKILRAAVDLGACISDGRSKIELDAKIKLVQQNLDISVEEIRKIIAELPRSFSDHCSSLELELPSLPEFLASYAEIAGAAPTASINTTEFEAFVQEIRQMVEDRESTASIITSIMETIAYGLKFDRVFLLLVSPNKQKLMGRMLLGSANGFDPKRFEQSVQDTTNCPSLKAFKEGRPVFKGDPIFPGGWPIAAIPVGLGNRAIGVIYTDRIPEEGQLGEDITQKDQASLTILGELLERSITSQARSS
jgi:HD-like signal output (HDOD) protein